MNTASAPRAFEAFDDGFDVDMDFSEPAAGAAEPAASALRFTAPPAAQPASDAATVRQALTAADVGQADMIPVAPAAAPATHVELAPAPATFQEPLPVSSGLAPVGAIGEVSVPRIAIHVFAERQDTLASAERAAQDRRLSRATTQIRVGGIAAAVEAYRHEPTPPLIIVE